MKKTLLTFAQILTLTSFAVAQQTPVSQSPTNKNVVLEELTGINCQYCPDGHLRANNLAAANPGRVILVNIHAGGYANTTPDLRTASGNLINTFLAPAGYPAGAVQRTPKAGETILATGRGNWSGLATTTLAQQSPVNVAMNAVVDAATRVATVTVEMYYTDAAAAGALNFLNVGYTQDNIEAPQVGMSLNPAQVLPNGKYNHNHVFRGFINTSGTWGDTITPTQANVITKTYTFTIPQTLNSTDVNIGHLHFFSFVHIGKNTYSNSQILSGAQVNPTFLNVSSPTASLTSIVNEFHIGCASTGDIAPKVKVSNSGGPITSITFETKVNGGTASTYNWTGNIPTFGIAEIQIPNIQFQTASNNNVEVKIVSVNGGSGVVGTVNTATKPISMAGSATGTSLTVEVLTDNYPTETTWELLGANNAVIASGGPYVGDANNGGGADALKTKIHQVSNLTSGCYSFKMKDSYGDGLMYGTNPGGGFGFRIKQGSTVIFSDVRSSYDFGTTKTIDGVVNFTLGMNDGIETLTVFKVYPNPTKDFTTIEFATNNTSEVNYKLVNSLGQIVDQKDLGSISGQSELNVDTRKLDAGVYFITLEINGVHTQQLLSVVK